MLFTFIKSLIFDKASVTFVDEALKNLKYFFFLFIVQDFFPKKSIFLLEPKILHEEVLEIVLGELNLVLSFVLVFVLLKELNI